MPKRRSLFVIIVVKKDTSSQIVLKEQKKQEKTAMLVVAAVNSSSNNSRQQKTHNKRRKHSLPSRFPEVDKREVFHFFVLKRKRIVHLLGTKKFQRADCVVITTIASQTIFDKKLDLFGFYCSTFLWFFELTN